MPAKKRDWSHEGCFRDKPCLVCKVEFKPRSGVHKFCSDKCKGIYKYTSGKVTTSSQYESISGNWYRYMARLKFAGGERRSNLTTEILLEMLYDQDYKCALTGVELTCQLEVGVKTLTNVSVDRIEAGGPYIKENVQLVCNAVNSFRGNTSVEEFKWWCRKVTEHGT